MRKQNGESTTTKQSRGKGRGGYNNSKQRKTSRSKCDERNKMSNDVDVELDARKTDRTSASNDVRWYAANPELLRAAASIPFNEVAGNVLYNNSTNVPSNVPGVMSLQWVPFMGGDYSPITQAANDIYSFTVHANSRNTSYAAADEMMMIMAGSQVFSAIAAGLRAYGTMKRYSQIDRYTPQALVEAMGFNFNDLKANLANMWFDLNQIIAKTHQIWIPNVLPVIERQYWMNSQIFMDGSSPKAQYYLYVQAVYFKLDETSSTQGTSLAPKVWVGQDGKATHTWAEYLTFVNELLDAIVASEDRGIIFGDILKAYGPAALYTLSSVTPDYTVEPVYDREVLSQIENATVWDIAGMEGGGVFATKPYNDIQGVKQNVTKQTIYHTLFKPASIDTKTHENLVQSSAPERVVLNFHQMEAPTPEQIMVATRMTSIGVTDSRDLDVVGFYPAHCGSEVCTKLIIYQIINSSGDLEVHDVSDYMYQISTTTGSGDSAVTVEPSLSYKILMLYNAFDWHPTMYWVEKAPHISTPTPNNLPAYSKGINAICDYDNYTMLEAGDLDKISTTAMYSLFGLPSRIG